MTAITTDSFWENEYIPPQLQLHWFQAEYFWNYGYSTSIFLGYEWNFIRTSDNIIIVLEIISFIIIA